MFKVFKNFLFLFQYFIKKIQYQFYTPDSFSYVISEMPYYSQFVSPDLLDDILSGNIAAEDDPCWRESGANTEKEYAIWGHNSCGMACLKMILDKKIDKRIPLVTLAKICEKYHGYIVNKDAQDRNDYANYFNGLFYKPFTRFVKEEFMMDACVISPMVTEEIIKAICEGNYVIASVHPDIKTPNAIPKGKNRGHLVLVVGYDTSHNVLFIHNPAGVYNFSQKYAQITFKDFNKFFAKRGIVIS